MSDNSTKKFIRRYEDRAVPTLFFSGMFQSPRENFHVSESVEIDIQRSGEEVAIAVQDMNTDYRANSADIFTNKLYTPPIFKEKFGLTSGQLINRAFGSNPFAEQSFKSKLVDWMFRGLEKMTDKIRRANELQSSQVLQTGTATMLDENGATMYEIDYKSKATHFPTTGLTWGPATTNIQSDLLSLANVIRADGKVDPNQLIFGETAWQSFINNADIQKLGNLRRMNLIDVSKSPRGEGANFHGMFDIGVFTFELWSYGGRFKDPQTGNSTKFLADDKVIMRATEGRFDATFGSIPHIGRELGIKGQNLLPGFPTRFGSTAKGMDMHVNVWLSPGGEQIEAGIGTRSLYAPTAIDTYGCLDTVT